MNIVFFTILFFAALATFVIVSLPRFCLLGFPVGSIIVCMTPSPSWVICGTPMLRLVLCMTMMIAKLKFVFVDSMLLAFNIFTAVITFNNLAFICRMIFCSYVFGLKFAVTTHIAKLKFKVTDSIWLSFNVFAAISAFDNLAFVFWVQPAFWKSVTSPKSIVFSTTKMTLGFLIVTIFQEVISAVEALQFYKRTFGFYEQCSLAGEGAKLLRF